MCVCVLCPFEVILVCKGGAVKSLLRDLYHASGLLTRGNLCVDCTFGSGCCGRRYLEQSAVFGNFG